MKRNTLFSVVAVLVLLLAFMFIGGCSGYNRLVNLAQETDKQWAQVQNVYQRRADLVPNLVATVSGSANFEKSTLVEVTNARASVGKVQIDPNTAPTSPEALQKFQAAQAELGGALSRLLVVVEKY